MIRLDTRIQHALFGLGVCAALGFGAAAAGADVRTASRGPILDSAEECQQYCAARGYARYSWDPGTGNCRCW